MRDGVPVGMGHQAVDVADVIGEEPPESSHVVVGPVSRGDCRRSGLDCGDWLRVCGWCSGHPVGAGWPFRRRLAQGEQAEDGDDIIRGVPGYDQVDFYDDASRRMPALMSGGTGDETRERPFPAGAEYPGWSEGLRPGPDCG